MMDKRVKREFVNNNVTGNSGGCEGPVEDLEKGGPKKTKGTTSYYRG